jgi:hypothetical protein
MTTTTNELRRLLSEATPGPWQAEFASLHVGGRLEITEWFVRLDGDDVAIAADIVDPRNDDKPSKANAALIAAAVNALPALLAVVEAAEAHREALWNDDYKLSQKRKANEALGAMNAALDNLREARP